jgi:hypothetical protein
MFDPIISPEEGISEDVIYDKSVQLLRSCAAHGIPIERVMVKAIAAFDAEPPFSRCAARARSPRLRQPGGEADGACAPRSSSYDPITAWLPGKLPENWLRPGRLLGGADWRSRMNQRL